jgi:hypothetical protein
MNDKHIQDWQEKVRQSFGDESKMFDYLFMTMDNFYYRYLETTSDKNLKTQHFGNHVWGIKSFESSMIDALKITNPDAKKGIIELAKSVPKTQGPKVQYELLANIEKLKAGQGEVHFVGIINWGFPDYNKDDQKFSKKVIFIYSDLAQFRKELAIKLEEVCSIFL